MTLPIHGAGTGIMDPGALPGDLSSQLRPFALKDRPQGSCSTPRIPTNEFPEYSTTMVATFDASGVAEFTLEAERDLLLTDMSLAEDIPDADLSKIRINVEYCNTKYLVNSSWRQWQRCCVARPQFLVGVRENKELKFRVTGGTPAETIALTVYGWQGKGCCDGVCDMDRIPTARWPLYSETKDATILATKTDAEVEFLAQRDVLFSTLSVLVQDSTGAVVPATVYLEYCNTDLIDGTDAEAFGYCCGRKPAVLLGLREDKRVKIRVVLDDADAEHNTNVEVTLTGYQGDGCCN